MPELKRIYADNHETNYYLAFEFSNKRYHGISIEKSDSAKTVADKLICIAMGIASDDHLKINDFDLENTYRVPDSIIAFIIHNTQHIEKPYELKPWSDNRSVVLVHGKVVLISVSYDFIEDNLELASEEFLRDYFLSTKARKTKVSEFKFELNKKVKISVSGEAGTVQGRAEYIFTDNDYFILYKNADGIAVKRWWSESDIEAIE